MKIKMIIISALMLACLQGEAQKKSKVTKPHTNNSDDWEAPMPKQNKSKTAKANTATINKNPKRRTKN